jgi:hypothetical protein
MSFTCNAKLAIASASIVYIGVVFYQHRVFGTPPDRLKHFYTSIRFWGAGYCHAFVTTWFAPSASASVSISRFSLPVLPTPSNLVALSISLKALSFSQSKNNQGDPYGSH